VEASYERLAELINDADLAYRRARAEVFDPLAFAPPSFANHLTEAQAAALDTLRDAESAVADFRAQMYGVLESV
jgi:hypothetical protein